jgi:dolichol-phosphate mannosyltransferase
LCAAGKYLDRRRKAAFERDWVAASAGNVKGSAAVRVAKRLHRPEFSGDVMRSLVVLPTYNERENLPLIVPALLEIEQVRVLIVDDQSPDGTGDLADRLAAQSGGRVSVLHREGVRGLGRSYLDGLRHALNTDANVICQMDADLSHQPAELPRLLRAAYHSDLVIGSRYVDGGRIINWPLRRTLLSRYANRYIRSVTGMPVKDCTGGFRCWRREALARLPLERVTCDGYAFLVELLWAAVGSGCRVAEVPITFIERRHGASKLNRGVLLESALLPWRLAVRSSTANAPADRLASEPRIPWW